MKFPIMVAALATALLSSVAIGQTQEPPMPQGPIHVVTYVEAAPASQGAVRAALKAYASEARTTSGSIRIAIGQEIQRGNRFLVEEVWKDHASFESHSRAAPIQTRLVTGLIAPPDIRFHTEWSVGTDRVSESPNALFGFTHVDVPPTRLTDLEAILRPYIDASRHETGALRFDLVQGLLPRKNHLTLIEAWTNASAFEKHQISPHAIEFRSKLGPLLGALYDQRLYSMLND